MTTQIDITRRPFRPQFQCQLTRTAPTVLTLSRFRGAWLMIAGEVYLIPSAGLTINANGLVANTTYYVYAFDDGSADHNPALEINTTVPVNDTTYGHLVKTGDASRSYVGRWTTEASSPPQFNANAFTSAGQFVWQPPLSISPLGLITRLHVNAALETGSAISLTTNTPANIASITLDAGEWDVRAIGYFNLNAATNITAAIGSISTTSATLNSLAGRVMACTIPAAGFTGGTGYATPLPPVRLSLSVTTIVYLVMQATFTVNTCAAWGRISAS
jgi:hypothetical protein